MALTLQELLGSPDHYLHSFEGEQVVFVPMEKSAYRRSIFLDARISPAGEGVMSVPLAALGAVPDTGERTGWIFHVAHCGSTLLARALEEMGDNLVLKEPAALRQLGFVRDDARLDLVLAKLSKRYDAALLTLVKANVPVNFILPEIVRRRPDDAAVLLYWNLADYLSAILRSDNHRQWLRGVTGGLSAYLGDLSGASDAARAGALWAGQMERFAVALDAMPHARGLDAERFFASPGETLAASSALFGMAPDPAKISALVDGPLFNTYSKRPDVAFDNADRIARAEAVATEVAAEVEEAAEWLSAQGRDHEALEARLKGHAL